jgi:hypothetical protein
VCVFKCWGGDRLGWWFALGGSGRYPNPVTSVDKTPAQARSRLAVDSRSVAYVAIIGGALALAGFVVLLVMVVWDRRGARNYWDES